MGECAPIKSLESQVNKLQVEASRLGSITAVEQEIDKLNSKALQQKNKGQDDGAGGPEWS